MIEKPGIGDLDGEVMGSWYQQYLFMGSRILILEVGKAEKQRRAPNMGHSRTRSQAET